MELEDNEQRKPTPKKGPVTVKLDEPVEWGQETIREVVLKPLKGKHVKILGKDPTLAQLLQLASKSSGLSAGVFDEMSSSDAFRVAEEVGNLL